MTRRAKRNIVANPDIGLSTLAKVPKPRDHQGITNKTKPHTNAARQQQHHILDCKLHPAPEPSTLNPTPCIATLKPLRRLKTPV